MQILLRLLLLVGFGQFWAVLGNSQHELLKNPLLYNGHHVQYLPSTSKQDITAHTVGNTVKDQTPSQYNDNPHLFHTKQSQRIGAEYPNKEHHHVQQSPGVVEFTVIKPSMFSVYYHGKEQYKGFSTQSNNIPIIPQNSQVKPTRTADQYEVHVLDSDGIYQEYYQSKLQDFKAPHKPRLDITVPPQTTTSRPTSGPPRKSQLAFIIPDMEIPKATLNSTKHNKYSSQNSESDIIKPESITTSSPPTIPSKIYEPPFEVITNGETTPQEVVDQVTITSARPQSSTSRYNGPDYHYLPATTATAKETTALPLQDHQWDSFSTERSNKTYRPQTRPSTAPLHNGYRYNTPAQKHPSAHAKTINGVNYNELGMGLNITTEIRQDLEPSPDAKEKTEIETNQGYVYGQPSSTEKEAITHLKPVSTIPSSYHYYRPQQGLKDTKLLQQNHINGMNQHPDGYKETTIPSRLSSYGYQSNPPSGNKESNTNYQLTGTQVDVINKPEAQGSKNNLAQNNTKFGSTLYPKGNGSRNDPQEPNENPRPATEVTSTKRYSPFLEEYGPGSSPLTTLITSFGAISYLPQTLKEPNNDIKPSGDYLRPESGGSSSHESSQPQPLLPQYRPNISNFDVPYDSQLTRPEPVGNFRPLSETVSQQGPLFENGKQEIPNSYPNTPGSTGNKPNSDFTTSEQDIKGYITSTSQESIKQIPPSYSSQYWEASRPTFKPAKGPVNIHYSQPHPQNETVERSVLSSEESESILHKTPSETEQSSMLFLNPNRLGNGEVNINNHSPNFQQKLEGDFRPFPAQHEYKPTSYQPQHELQPSSAGNRDVNDGYGVPQDQSSERLGLTQQRPSFVIREHDIPVKPTGNSNNPHKHYYPAEEISRPILSSIPHGSNKEAHQANLSGNLAPIAEISSINKPSALQEAQYAGESGNRANQLGPADSQRYQTFKHPSQNLYSWNQTPPSAEFNYEKPQNPFKYNSLPKPQKTLLNYMPSFHTSSLPLGLLPPTTTRAEHFNPSLSRLNLNSNQNLLSIKTPSKPQSQFQQILIPNQESTKTRLKSPSNQNKSSTDCLPIHQHSPISHQIVHATSQYQPGKNGSLSLSPEIQRESEILSNPSSQSTINSTPLTQAGFQRFFGSLTQNKGEKLSDSLPQTFAQKLGSSIDDMESNNLLPMSKLLPPLFGSPKQYPQLSLAKPNENLEAPNAIPVSSPPGSISYITSSASSNEIPLNLNKAINVPPKPLIPEANSNLLQMPLQSYGYTMHSGYPAHRQSYPSRNLPSTPEVLPITKPMVFVDPPMVATTPALSSKPMIFTEAPTISLQKSVIQPRLISGSSIQEPFKGYLPYSFIAQSSYHKK